MVRIECGEKRGDFGIYAKACSASFALSTTDVGLEMTMIPHDTHLHIGSLWVLGWIRQQASGGAQREQTARRIAAKHGFAVPAVGGERPWQASDALAGTEGLLALSPTTSSLN
jgi:hypothetical protein